MTRQFHRCHKQGFAILLTLSMLFAVVSRASGQTANLNHTSHNFRSVAVGATSAAYNVTLSNTSTTTALTITSITPSGPFAETNTCGSSLGTSSSCTISITFTPTAVGSATGSVVITDNATSATQTITLSGTGIADLTVSPTSHRFGTEAEGTTSAAATFTLTNNSTTAVPVTIVSSSPTEFIESDNCDGQVAASSTCTISVAFDPIATGAQTGTVTVTYSGGTATITLTGTGRAALTLTPTAHNFGSVGVDETSATETFTVTNNSTAAQTLAVSTAAPFAETNTCGTSLAGSSTCTISATFDPIATGTASGTLTVSNGAGTTLTSTLTGNGVSALRVSPSSLTFSSNATVGEATAARTVTLTNNGSSAVTIDSIVASPAAYAITANTCGTSVAADSSCTLSIVFTPTVTGTTTGTLTITYGSTNAQIVVAITGGAQVNRLVSLAITDPSATLAAGATEQFTATGTYANGTTGNVTDAATWTSSNTAVATVSSTGLVTGVAAGTTSIGASVAGTNDGTVTATAVTLSVSGEALTGITLTGTQGTTNALSAPTLAVGATEQVYATGTYANGTIQDITSSVTWTSSNNNASVADGLITGVAAGTSTISAALSGITASTTATVTASTLTAITIVGTLNATTALASPTLVAGTTLQVYATGTYSNGSTQDITAAAQWTSSIPGDATVAAGLIDALAAGTPTISAALSGVTGSLSVTVTTPTLVSIAITPGTASVAAGDSQQFTATGTYSNNTTQNITADVTWSTSNSGVVMSSTTAGLATAGDAAIGASVQISATMGTVTAATPALLTVNPAALVSIAVTPANPSIPSGETEAFTATGTYSDGTTATLTTTVTWSATTASGGGAATFSTTSLGVAQATAQGVVTITATSGTISGSTTLTVIAPVLTSIVVTNVAPATPPAAGTAAVVTIYQGQTEQFYALGTYSDSSIQNITSTVTWSAGTGSIATISTGTSTAPLATAGLATAVAGGTVAIVATSGTITSATTGGDGSLTVIGLSSITVTPSDPTATPDPSGANSTLQFTATATFANSTTQNVTASAAWTSGTTTVATIGGTTGLATMVAAGTSTITATYAGVSGSTTLTVSPATLESVAVCLGAYPSTNCSTSTTPVGVTLGLNGTQQFSAVATYSDGTTVNVTDTATWSSGNAIVTVSATGLATVVSGEASAVAVAITASYGGFAPDQNIDTAFVSAPALASACSSPTIAMNVLVVNNAAENYADFPAIEQILNYVGTPYTVVDAVSGPVPTLYSGCTANYQGVIFANGGDYSTISWQSALITFEQTFNIRQVNWYSYPSFGLTPTGTDIASTATYTTSFTSSAAPVFFYANLTNPLTIANAYVYLASADAASGGTLTPLLEDASGNIVSAIYTYNNQQFLTQTFDSNPSLTHDLVLAYGLLNWVTKGVFLGDYHVYATQQVDDNFINDAEWIPSTPCLTSPGVATDRTAPDASNLPVFRANSSDMTQLVAWQTAKQADPLLSPGVTYETSANSGKFELTLAMNGVGTTGNGDWTGLVAPIISDSVAGGVATFTAQDFSGQVGDTVTISNTVNGGGLLNGNYTITSVTLSAATTPGTNTFTVANTAAAAFTTTAELGVVDNSTTPTVSETDSLVANLSSFQGNFHWISHTYDHPATLNGLCQTAPAGDPTNCGNTTDTGDDIELEILTNDYVASQTSGVNLDTLNSPCSGGGTVGYCDTVPQLTFTDFNPANIITPGVTGLNDPNVPGYLYGYGIRYAVSDTSVATTTDPPNNNGPNPSPNVGIVNSYEPLLYEVPRHPNDVFYNVANWADDQAEFDCIYTYYVPPGVTPVPAPAIDSPFNTYNAAQVLDFTSTAFVNNMLMGDMDPEMFHQPDLHFSQNYTNLTNPSATWSSSSAIPAPSQTIPASVTNYLGTSTSHVSSLLTDTYDLTFSKYEALYQLPVLTPTLDQLGVLMQNRNSFNLSGVTASIVNAGTSSAEIVLTMPSTATVTTAIVPVTGLTTTGTGSEVYGGQNISHISMTPGLTVTAPLP